VGGTRGECVAACTMHTHFVVCRMDSCLHWISRGNAELFDSKGQVRDSANGCGSRAGACHALRRQLGYPY
jgi:hypothetical protein